MKHTRILIAIILIFLMAGNADAFDCKRKGFVAGLGSGYAPLLKRSGEDDRAFEKDGPLMEYQVGYAWNDRNMVFLLGHFAGYEEQVEYYADEFYSDDSVLHRDDVEFRQIFMGIAFRRYLIPEAASFFVQGGPGIIAWGYDNYIPRYLRSKSGPGLLIGGGFEPAHHFTIQANLTYGRAGGDNYTTFSLSLVALMY
jgi:hypothetical protein